MQYDCFRNDLQPKTLCRLGACVKTASGTAAHGNPGVPLKHEIGEYETLLSNRKAREVLGFRSEHSWRKYLPQT